MNQDQKELIIKLSKRLNNYWNDVIIKTFPELFEKRITYNKWLKDDRFPKWMCYYTNKKVYGIDANGNWIKTKLKINKKSLSINRLATHQEIEGVLINEARKKYTLPQQIRYLDGKIGVLEGFFLQYNMETNSLCASGKDKYIVFKNGKWAKPITTLTEKELLKKHNIIIE